VVNVGYDGKVIQAIVNYIYTDEVPEIPEIPVQTRHENDAFEIAR
jgi:hypothetical protein